MTEQTAERHRVTRAQVEAALEAELAQEAARQARIVQLENKLHRWIGILFGLAAAMWLTGLAAGLVIWWLD
jgi:hypothetical protein